jgi:hypothetical protein
MKMDPRTTQLKKQFLTLEVLAVAVSAYQHNHARVERHAVDTDAQHILPNRQLISEYLDGNRANLPIVSDHDRKHAEGIVQYLQQTGVMQALVNRSDRFLAQINELLLRPTVTSKDFGLLAWAPKLSDDYQKKDQVREISARFEYASRYIGKIGDKIQTNFTLIDSRYIQSMNCHAVYGNDDQGNLIFYWARDEKKIVTSGLIHGRVKSHKQDSYRGNARVTTFNYVKVI